MAKMIKSFIRKAFGVLFFYSGIFHLVRFFYNIWGRRITIVTYHRITDKRISEIEASLPFLFTSRQIFEKQLLFIKKRYNVITFEELMKWGKDGRPPWNCLIITFDDGYEDNFRYAYRTLSKMGLPGVFFITVDKIGNERITPYWWDRLYYYLKEIQKQEDQGISNGIKGELLYLYEAFKKNASDFFGRMNREETDKIERLLDRFEEEYQVDKEILFRENRMLSWEQISEMGPRHEFGSHSCSHQNLLRLGDDQRYHEIVESKAIIERSMKGKVRVFSCPAGHLSEEIQKVVEKGGYEFAVTTRPGVNRMNDRYHLKRINVWEGTSLSLEGEFSKGHFSFKLLGF